MFGIEKRKILSWSVISSCLLFACETTPTSIEGYEIVGETQGTTYSIIVAEVELHFTKAQIDSLLGEFDTSLSTYIDNSVISGINSASGTYTIKDPSGFFKKCYEESQEVYQATGGQFDPSVFPLVKGWGFMNDMESPLSKEKVDSILAFVSFESGALHSMVFSGDNITVEKKDDRFRLDFNAIAQGLSVDVLADYIDRKGHNNYYIEIGGEVRVKGVNREGVKWRIGVDSPKEDQTTRELIEVINVSDKAIATSGNYRKFYVHDGVKYAHTLNPKTGFPVTHSLLSATVIANDCAYADAYATAFMVMGKENALQFIIDHPELGLEAFLLYADSNGAIVYAMSEGFENYLSE